VQVNDAAATRTSGGQFDFLNEPPGVSLDRL
jgi:hypothetical protein